MKKDQMHVKVVVAQKTEKSCIKHVKKLIKNYNFIH